MKKNIFVALIITLSLIGCSSLKKENSSVDSVSWRYSRNLPAPKGFKEQFGVAGAFSGNIGDYIIIAGGANFPYKSVLEGGKKVIYSDIYLMKQGEKGLELIEHKQLDEGLGYGSTISTKNGVYFIGGQTENGVSNKILYIKLNDNKNGVVIEKVGELPFTYQSGISVIKNEKIYILTGKQNGKNSKSLYSYDIKTGTTKRLADFPGTERSQSVGQILNNGIEDMLYIFGGGTGVAFTDGYGYSFKNNSWEKVANVKINEKNISVLGGNSIKLNNNEMMVIGGFNKKIWDLANLNLGNLKGDKLKKYKTKYFTKDPQDFNWNQNILIYNAKFNEWKKLGEIPFLAPCGQGLIKIEDKIYSINGEIKPGVRTKKIFIGEIK